LVFGPIAGIAGAVSYLSKVRGQFGGAGTVEGDCRLIEERWQLE
jgi:hypothetical protein